MLTTFQFRTFCLPTCYLNTYRLKYAELLIYLWFCVAVKLASLTLGEEYTLRVIENRFLWKIFGPKREAITGGWG
jgi:hypothetical protein